jgi:radical SAM protein with 4Fe4S-binding SPASM domain
MADLQNDVNYVKTVSRDNDPVYAEYRENWERYPREGIVSDYPLHISMELNNDCNKACSCCIRPGETQMMDTRLKEKIFLEIDKKVLALCPNYLGEPMLHMEILLDWIQRAKEAGAVDIRMNTNGSLLTPKTFAQLSLAGLDLLSISVDKYHKNEDIMQNVRWYKELRKWLATSKPIIRQSSIVDPKGTNTVAYSEVFDEVIYRELMDYGDNTEDATPLPNWRCEQLWQKLMIKADGGVQPCCGIPYDGEIIGDINVQSIHEIWHGSPMTKIREFHLRGESHLLDICAKCPLRKMVVQKEKAKQLDKEVVVPLDETKISEPYVKSTDYQRMIEILRDAGKLPFPTWSVPITDEDMEQIKNICENYEFRYEQPKTTGANGAIDPSAEGRLR